MMIANLLRLDLVRRYWSSYCFVCVIALLVHAAFIATSGIRASTDFGLRYDYGARQLLAWLGESGTAADSTPTIGAYGWSRLGYISYVALCYSLWGRTLEAVVYPQIAITWLLYPLMFHILLTMTGRHLMSLGAICVWLSFYDGYQWHLWALPDALYRILFVSAFFLLLRLWEERRESAFVVTTLVATLAATLFRIETPLYALPAIFLSIGVLGARWPKLVWAGAIVLVITLWLAREPLGEIFGLFVYLQTQGFVLPGSGHDIPGLTALARPVDDSPLAWAMFFVHLFSARLWYAATPFPALWSDAHRLYYAVYVLAAYSLTLCGLLAWRQSRPRYFFLCLYLFAAGIALQVLVAVDPSMRYAYTPQVFLFFCAAMSWPDARALVVRWFRSAPAPVAL